MGSGTHWRELPAAQQPDWPDLHAYESVLDAIRAMPPLVFAGEARQLTAQLGEVCEGRAFLLQAGDCAESFVDFSANRIRDSLKVILQMAVVLTYGSGVPVVKLGRMAGQFAKPRSSPIEKVGEVELPSFRGHIVHDDAFDAAGRVPDPQRLLTAYNQSAAMLNLVRALTKGGFAGLSQIHAWNQEFVASSAQGQRYEQVAGEIERALKFMAACGIDLNKELGLQQVDFFTSHEALLLGYEEALTREDSLTGLMYDCSAHLVWVGDRTRQLGGAHLAFLSEVSNPVAAKLGLTSSPADVVAICEHLNPDRVPGRLSLITRLGARHVTEALPPLVAAAEEAGHPVVWVCDPMHGNTLESPSGRKTRHFDDVMTEIGGFFDVHRALGTVPGGIHIELTGDNVTECLGGAEEVLPDHLETRYTTTCDPRLNARQSLDLAYRVAELLRA